MRHLKTMAVWFGLGIYVLGLAELCVRWMAPVPLMPRYITGTPWGVRGNIPGATYRHVTPEVNVEYRINSQGMRADRDFSQRPDAQNCRIAMIGDSFFMGYELNLHDTIATRLEESLAALGQPTEVLNFSVSGFGTAEALRTYEARIRQFEPDVVLMQWHSTDIDDNLRSNLYTVDGGGVRRVADSYLPSVALQDALMKWRIYRWASDYSQLYSVVRETLATAVKISLGRKGAEREATGGDSGAGAEGPGVELAARLIAEMRRQVEGDGRVFLVVDIPDPQAPGSRISKWPQLPATIVKDVAVIHAGDIFSHEFSADVRLYFEKGHHHLTPVATRSLAKQIAATLQARLPQSSCGNRINVQGLQ